MLHKAFTALFFVCIGSAKTRKKQDSPVFEKIKLITRKETTTMKLRTFTALLLAAIMLFALTACGSQAADDSSSIARAMVISCFCPFDIFAPSSSSTVS